MFLPGFDAGAVLGLPLGWGGAGAAAPEFPAPYVPRIADSLELEPEVVDSRREPGPPAAPSNKSLTPRRE